MLCPPSGARADSGIHRVRTSLGALCLVVSWVLCGAPPALSATADQKSGGKVGVERGRARITKGARHNLGATTDAQDKSGAIHDCEYDNSLKSGAPLDKFPAPSFDYRDTKTKGANSQGHAGAPCPNNVQNQQKAESWAVSPEAAAWSYGYATTMQYGDPSKANWAYYHALAYAETDPGQAARNPKAKSVAGFRDPWLLEWDSDLEDTLEFDWVLDESHLTLESLLDGSGKVDSFFDVWFDLNLDGVQDQLMWSLALTAHETGHEVDLELGPGVYIGDGRSEAEFEADLESYWSDPCHFAVPGSGSPLLVTFSLDLSLAGSGAFDIHYDGEVWAQESRTPEPGTAALLAFAGGAGLFARRVRRRG